MKRLSGNYLDYFLHQVILSSPLVLILWIILSIQQNKLVINPVVISLMAISMLTIALIGFLILLFKISKHRLTSLYFNEKNNALQFGNESFTINEIEGIRVIDKGTGRLILDLLEFDLFKNNIRSKVVILDRVIVPFVHYYELPRTLKVLCDKFPKLRDKIKTDANKH